MPTPTALTDGSIPTPTGDSFPKEKEDNGKSKLILAVGILTVIAVTAVLMLIIVIGIVIMKKGNRGKSVTSKDTVHNEIGSEYRGGMHEYTCYICIYSCLYINMYVQWNLIITATNGPNISCCYIEVDALQRCKCIESHHLELNQVAVIMRWLLN